jgi:metal-responsive CopG/Arc/MetJ family transcriptional regulator
MRAPRAIVSIPQKLAAGIDKITGGQKHRTHFIVEVLETELQRREQVAALEEAAGCWKDENHPELANGSEAFIRELRSKAEHRLDEIQRQTSE